MITVSLSIGFEANIQIDQRNLSSMVAGANGARGVCEGQRLTPCMKR
jgi:hypothetical protein